MACFSHFETAPNKSPQSQTEGLKKQILLLGSGFGFHVDDLLAIVVTAVLADTVGELHLLAARALDDTGRGQLPVRATHTAAGLRDFSLGKSHCLHLLILVQQRC